MTSAAGNENDSANSKASLHMNVGGDAKGNAVVQGDGNVITVNYREVVLPSPDQVDIRQELRALQDILSGLVSDSNSKIEGRLAEAIEEAARPEPNKGDIGDALEGAIKYAKRADEFSEIAEILIPRITQVGGWLGAFGTPLLDLMGLTTD